MSPEVFTPVKHFPALFSCNDRGYQRRLGDFMSGKMTMKDRRALRAKWQLDAKHPKSLADKYGLEYDTGRDY